MAKALLILWFVGLLLAALAYGYGVHCVLYARRACSRVRCVSYDEWLREWERPDGVEPRR